jgi:hypothetical protein
MRTSETRPLTMGPSCADRVAEHGCPFTEAEIGRDDDAGPLVELAQQWKEQSFPGSPERQVAELVKNDELFPVIATS